MIRKLDSRRLSRGILLASIGMIAMGAAATRPSPGEAEAGSKERPGVVSLADDGDLPDLLKTAILKECKATMLMSAEAGTGDTLYSVRVLCVGPIYELRIGKDGKLLEKKENQTGSFVSRYIPLEKYNAVKLERDQYKERLTQAEKEAAVQRQMAIALRDQLNAILTANEKR